MQISVQCPVHSSFRVAQVGGMFDVPIQQKSVRTFDFESPPGPEENWRIGLIVGPSGSGKSTIAKHFYSDDIYRGDDWSDDRAVIDGFGDLPIREVTRLLTLVGFSSPPSWIKPYQVLSNGERFRCDLARALAVRTGEFVVFDEYTSVVDRNVAKIASAAISKGIRSGRINARFVAVTCHYDVADWLEPDWILDMATGRARRRCLRRPRIEVDIFRCSVDAWKLFGTHHYLSASIHRGSECYLAAWNSEPVAFCALLPDRGRKGRRRVSRIVTLPDYQGVGIGGRFLDTMGVLKAREGLTLSIVASHPSIIHHCKRSPHWRCLAVAKNGYRPQHGARHSSHGRAVVSFEFVADR